MRSTFKILYYINRGKVKADGTILGKQQLRAFSKGMDSKNRRNK